MALKFSKKKGMLYVLILTVIAAAIIFGSRWLQSRAERTPSEQSSWFVFEKLDKKNLTKDQIELFDKSVAEYNQEWTGKAALLNVGYIYMDARQYAAAANSFRRYLEHDNFDSDARLGYARALRAQERTIDAEAQYYLILDFDPLYLRAYQEALDLYMTGALAPNQKFMNAISKARELDKEGKYTADLNELAKKFTELKLTS